MTDKAPRPAWVGWLFTLLKLLLAALLLGWILSRPEFEWRKLANVFTTGYFGVVLVVGLLAISASGLRWLLLLRGEGVNVTLWTAVKLTWIGHFWNMVIPGAVSGDAVKMFYVGRIAPERREEAWTTVFADRAIGLGAMVALAGVASIVRFDFMTSRPELQALLVSVGLALAAFVVGLIVVASGLGQDWRITAWATERLPAKILPIAQRAYSSLQRTCRRPKILLAAFTISFLAHACAVGNCFLLGQALQESDLSLMQYGVVVPVALFSNSIPLTPGGGVGVGETVIGKLFLWSGGSEGKGAMVMLSYRVMFFALAGLGAALYAFYRSSDPTFKGVEEDLKAVEEDLKVEMAADDPPEPPTPSDDAAASGAPV